MILQNSKIDSISKTKSLTVRKRREIDQESAEVIFNRIQQFCQEVSFNEKIEKCLTPSFFVLDSN